MGKIDRYLISTAHTKALDMFKYIHLGLLFVGIGSMFTNLNVKTFRTAQLFGVPKWYVIIYVGVHCVWLSSAVR